MSHQVVSLNVSLISAQVTWMWLSSYIRQQPQLQSFVPAMSPTGGSRGFFFTNLGHRWRMFYIASGKPFIVVNLQKTMENHKWNSGKPTKNNGKSPFIVETHLPTPMTARVYLNLLEGNIYCWSPKLFFFLPSHGNVNFQSDLVSFFGEVQQPSSIVSPDFGRDWFISLGDLGLW